jgi:hypothetical protein
MLPNNSKKWSLDRPFLILFFFLSAGSFGDYHKKFI